MALIHMCLAVAFWWDPMTPQARFDHLAKIRKFVKEGGEGSFGRESDQRLLELSNLQAKDLPENMLPMLIWCNKSDFKPIVIPLGDPIDPTRN